MLKRGKVKNNVFLGIVYTLILIIFILFLSSFASASFTLGNKSEQINAVYSLNEKISGWINISIANESYNSEFSDSFGNKIGFIDFLNKYYPKNYSCIPSNCGNDYILSSNGEASKSFSLNANSGNEKLIGIRVDGRNVEVTKFSLDIASNAQASCNAQLGIDFLDNNESNWGNKKAILEDCVSEVKSSCYSSGSGFSDWFMVSSQPYCEKIILPQAPAFEIKAMMKKDAGAMPAFSNGLLKASIYDKNKNFAGECNLTSPLETESRVSCIVNYAAKETSEHYLCVEAYTIDNVEISGYKLQGKSSGSFCGFLGEPSQTSGFSKDYNIVVSAKKFDAVGSFKINETLYEEQNANGIITDINNYLTSRYSRNCDNGCLMPIKLYGAGQDITLNNLKAEYTSEGSAGTETGTLYFLGKTLPKINTKFLKLDFGLMNFSVNGEGNKTLRLYLNDNEILNKNITIVKPRNQAIKQVYPKNVATATSTLFVAFVDSSINTSGKNFVWDFGDESSIETTSTNKIKHTYNELRNYTLRIKLLNGTNELGSSVFNISAESPKQAINSTLKEYQDKFSKAKTQINALPASYKTILKEEHNLDADEITSTLNSIDSSYKQLLSSATTKDSDYVSIMTELNALDIPQAVQSSSTSQIKIINDVNELDLSKANDVFDESYDLDMQDEYKNAILAWFLDNIDAEVKHKIISVYYNDRTENAISEFVLEIKPKAELGEVYIMINANSEKILFDGDYEILDSDEATGVKVDFSGTSGKTIKFAIKDSVNVFELPMFILPKSSDLSMGESIISRLKPKSFLVRFLIGMLITLIIALAIYIFLQEWYKKNYENSLFKDKNQLYNLIYFISNAKRRNLSDEEIRKRLKSQWKSEQIGYAIKKFEGKRVGMWELPIFRGREQKKIRQEIMKRGPRRII